MLQEFLKAQLLVQYFIISFLRFLVGTRLKAHRVLADGTAFIINILAKRRQEIKPLNNQLTNTARYRHLFQIKLII